MRPDSEGKRLTQTDANLRVSVCVCHADNSLGNILCHLSIPNPYVLQQVFLVTLALFLPPYNSLDGLPGNVTKIMCAHRCGRKMCVVMILNGQIDSNNDKKLPCGAS